jgi:ankyrin repeat protein
LISKGSADVVEIPNMIGYSPLRIAMTRGFTDIHKLLAETLSTNFNSNDELRQQPGYHDIRAGESNLKKCFLEDVVRIAFLKVNMI